MSVTRITEIQRHLALDDKALAILRNFDIDWNCGTRLLLAMVKQGIIGTAVRDALAEALFEYSILCQQGRSDTERLYHLLHRLFRRLAELGKPVPTDMVDELCEQAIVPPQVREHLLNG